MAELTISSPGARAVVAVDSAGQVPVAFTLANFTLKAPGTCGAAAACGHLHLNVDGDACNDVGAPYNNAGVASPVSAKLALCATSRGLHEATLSLHNDDHSPALANGVPVAAHATFTAAEVDQPAIVITTPEEGATVPVGADADATVAVAYSVSSFTLKAPGSCGVSARCGHVHLLVDGAACNGAGVPYNAAGVMSPASVALAKCANPSGMKIVRAELHNDDHSPVVDATGNTIASAVTFNAVRAGAPLLAITSPARGAQVVLDADADRAVDIAFTLAGFVLKAPGACAGAASCGHLHLQIDGDACNETGAPYNNAAVSSPAVAKLARCATSAGAHVVTLSLHNDDHSPALDGAGRAIFALREFTAVAGTTGSIAIVSPAQNGMVALGAGAERGVPVYYAVRNFTLKAPGTCGAAQLCGHVHLKVDGATCNDGSAPYNNAGAAGPLLAKLSKCTVAAGTHTVTLTLHNDDHSPAAGSPGANSTFTACEAGRACVAFTAPGEGASMTLSANNQSPVDFAVQNFTLKAPGACSGAANCGHAHVLVDGTACNASGAPYNTAGAMGPLSVLFGNCPSPTVPATVTDRAERGA